MAAVAMAASSRRSCKHLHRPMIGSDCQACGILPQEEVLLSPARHQQWTAVCAFTTPAEDTGRKFAQMKPKESTTWQRWMSPEWPFLSQQLAHLNCPQNSSHMQEPDSYTPAFPEILEPKWHSISVQQLYYIP
ncbi:hypothetical protein Bbelb_447390 [Branchiostoma belcheri]|nr:hypothetical protein Bbelb_447390 [Branchiostoma belcheri]